MRDYDYINCSDTTLKNIKKYQFWKTIKKKAQQHYRFNKKISIEELFDSHVHLNYTITYLDDDSCVKRVLRWFKKINNTLQSS